MIPTMGATADVWAALNFRRIKNAASLLYAYRLSKYHKKVQMKGLPMAMSIEPTTACNLRCPECPSGLRAFSRPTGFMEESLFQNIILQAEPHLVYLTFYFQGEPFLHPRFLNMVSYARSKNIFTATSTNAHYLSPEIAEKVVKSGLNRIIVSMDGISQEVYASYRIGGKVNTVMQGIVNLVEAKKKLKKSNPEIILQALILKPNAHELPAIAAWGNKIGVNKVLLKTAQVYDLSHGEHTLIPDGDARNRYRKRSDGTWEIKHELLNHCWRMWQGCVVTWDGKVVPCCFDKDAKHILGDLKRQSLKDIWQGEKYQLFREAIFRSRKEIDICTNCTEGAKVWA
jgi:radical SAM protein with 4Fe4S-binding SPASM domain